MNAKADHFLKTLFSIDLRALAVLRIALAVLILADLAGRIPLFNVFYVTDSPFPLQLARLECPLWLFPHLFNDSAVFQATLFVLATAFALSLLLGFHTRIACFASWYLLVSMQFRNLNLLSVGDYIMALILFWSIFLPLGSRYSFDQTKIKKNQFPAHLAYSTASAAILLQVAFVYFFASLAKMKGAAWLEGEAVEIVLNAGVWVMPLGEELLQFPSFLVGLTYLTLGIEFFCPLLLFIPIATKYFRYFALLSLFCFHIGIATTIALHLIPFQMTAALIPFLPSDFWDRVEHFFFKTVKNTVDTTPVYLGAGHQWINILLLPILLFISLSNIDRVYSRVSLIPHKIEKIAKSILLEQGWFMYAPSPIAGDYRVYLQGKLSDGSSIHYAIGAERRRWPKTEHWDEAEIFWGQYRARVYLYDKLVIDSKTAETEFFLRWITRRWNEKHPNRQLIQLEMYKVIRWPPLLSDTPSEEIKMLHSLSDF